MRILIVDTCYPAFLAEHYAGRPSLAEESYEDQWTALMGTFFGTADAYSHHLEAVGHTAHEVVVNCAPMQSRWAAENGITPGAPAFPGDPRGRDDVLLAQAEAFAPDVCYVQNLETLRASTLRALSASGYFLVGQASTEPPSRRRLRLYDLLVTPLPFMVDRFRALGIRCEYLPLAFDSRVLDRVPQVSGSYGAVFVGSLKRFRRWGSNRIVERAAHRVHIDFWGYGANQWPPSSPMRTNYHGPAWGLDMLGVLAASRIGVNRHGDITAGYACNMRLYEATGVGTMLLTDGRKNLDDLFRVGAEVVRYTDASDLERKIAYYLQNEDERREIARAGQARTLSDHTYARRMAQLSEILEAELVARRTP